MANLLNKAADNKVDPSQLDTENKGQSTAVQAATDALSQEKQNTNQQELNEAAERQTTYEGQGTSADSSFQVPSHLRDLMPPTEEELIERESAGIDAPEPIAAFKHRQVRHFKVGDFEFKNHVLYITTQAGLEGFLKAYDGLPARDKNEIVQYNWRAAASIETPVNVARGSMSTGAIKDPKRIA